MADYNILMKQLNEAGLYDNLFPNANDAKTLNGYNYTQILDNAVNQALAKGVKIQTGSYVGTGTYGASNPNTLTFIKIINEGGHNYGF